MPIDFLGLFDDIEATGPCEVNIVVVVVESGVIDVVITVNDESDPLLLDLSSSTSLFAWI